MSPQRTSGQQTFGRALGLAAAAAVALIAAGAAAQAQPPAGGSPTGATPWGTGAAPWAPVPHPEGESTVVSEVQVVKRLPGPAVWKVSKGASQVFILGALTPLPHMLVWDTGPLQNDLNGATVLLTTPPRLKPGLFDIVGFLFSKGALQNPGGRSLEQVLPPPERARFLRLLQVIHKRPQDYARWKPAVAGFLLIGDFRRAAGLSDAKPSSTVVKLAQADRVPVKYVGQYKIGVYLKTASHLTDAQNTACFDAALDDIDREAAHARAAAQAWANADLKTVEQSYAMSTLDRCLLQVPNMHALVDQGTADGVKEINDALSRPGKAVAVIDLNFLLRANGVLDRLKAEGDTISAP